VVAVVPAKRNLNFQSVIDGHHNAPRMWSSGASRRSSVGEGRPPATTRPLRAISLCPDLLRPLMDQALR
jgi:hypothetical protein